MYSIVVALNVIKERKSNHPFLCHQLHQFSKVISVESIMPDESQTLTASLNEKIAQSRQLEQILYSLPDTDQNGLITRYEVSGVARCVHRFLVLVSMWLVLMLLLCLRLSLPFFLSMFVVVVGVIVPLLLSLLLPLLLL